MTEEQKQAYARSDSITEAIMAGDDQLELANPTAAIAYYLRALVYSFIFYASEQSLAQEEESDQ